MATVLRQLVQTQVPVSWSPEITHLDNKKQTRQLCFIIWVCLSCWDLCLKVQTRRFRLKDSYRAATFEVPAGGPSFLHAETSVFFLWPETFNSTLRQWQTRRFRLILCWMCFSFWDVGLKLQTRRFRLRGCYFAANFEGPAGGSTVLQAASFLTCWNFCWNRSLDRTLLAFVALLFCNVLCWSALACRLKVAIQICHKHLKFVTACAAFRRHLAHENHHLRQSNE